LGEAKARKREREGGTDLEREKLPGGEEGE
jgi:hypothetical protein